MRIIPLVAQSKMLEIIVRHLKRTAELAAQGREEFKSNRLFEAVRCLQRAEDEIRAVQKAPQQSLLGETR